MTPNQRDIVLIPVPFTDLTTTKQRPVLVISATPHNRKSADIVVAAITSNLKSPGVGLQITSDDLDRGNLPVDSLVRADKIYTLSKSIVVKRFGRLSEASLQAVLWKLDSVLGKK